MTRDQLERAVLTSATVVGRNSQMRRVHGLEDYLHIGGHRMSARLGRSPRTITRYRAVLREVA